MLTIAKALSENRITRRNVYHIDMNIDSATRQCMKDARFLGLSDVPLIDQLKKNSIRANSKFASKLPLPKGTWMKNGKLAKQVDQLEEKSTHGIQVSLTESQRRASLPTDLIDEERDRLHVILFSMCPAQQR